jgi:hypothetical protein
MIVKIVVPNPANTGLNLWSCNLPSVRLRDSKLANGAVGGN